MYVGMYVYNSKHMNVCMYIPIYKRSTRADEQIQIHMYIHIYLHTYL